MFVLQLTKGVLLRDIVSPSLYSKAIVLKTTSLFEAYMRESKKDLESIAEVLSSLGLYTPVILTCSEFINSIERGEV